MQKIKPPGRPHITTDAETTERIVEAFDASPQKSTRLATRVRHISHEQCLFQQDGAPPHYAIAVREILDDHLQNRWVGRRDHIEWPARSPDLTACGYWLWGYLKVEVYARKPQDV